MVQQQLHTDGDCGTDCPACAYYDAQPTTWFADDDADNNPTVWAQTGDEKPRPVLRLTALEPSDDREDHWLRIVDALELLGRQEAGK